MPRKTGTDLKDPVGAITRAIVRADSDYSHGKPSVDDFVRIGREVLDLPARPVLEGEIAEQLWQDAGERYAAAGQMAAYIYARLTTSAMER